MNIVLSLCIILPFVAAFLSTPLEEIPDSSNVHLMPLVLEKEPSKKPPEIEKTRTNDDESDDKEMEHICHDQASYMSNIQDKVLREKAIFNALKAEKIEKRLMRRELTKELTNELIRVTLENGKLSASFEALMKEWSIVRARSAIEYFEDAFGLDSDISSEDVTKMQDLIKKTDAIRKTRGERIYEEKVHDRLKIFRRAALWYKMLTAKNTIYPATLLLKKIKDNEESPNTQPEFSLCIAQAYKDLSQALIHPAIFNRVSESKMYDVNLAVFGCSSKALQILLSIYTLDPPARSTDTS